MRQLILRFRADDSGAEMVEWAVVTIVLLVATVPVLILLRDKITEAVHDVLNNLQEDPKDEFVPIP